jgi:hypothetical protein
MNYRFDINRANSASGLIDFPTISGETQPLSLHLE